MNKVILIGNLTRDPDPIRTIPGKNGNPSIDVCSFTIAVNRRGVKTEDEQTADFFRINAWRGLAQSCHNYLSKGKKVSVIGELQARLYESKEGKTQLSLDVHADEVEFLSPKGDATKQSMDQMADIPAEDIPF